MHSRYGRGAPGSTVLELLCYCLAASRFRHMYALMTNSFSRRALIAGYDRIGGLVDPFTIASFKRWLFPSLRIWAAANAAKGDADLLAPHLPERGQRRLRQKAAQLAFAKNEALRVAAGEATARWRKAVIDGDGSADPADAERARRRAASAHLAMSGPLAAAIGRRGIALVDWAIDPPGAMPPNHEDFAAPKDWQAVKPGPIYQEGHLLRRWLSAPAETGLGGDVAYARASWPAEGPIKGALVIGSGVGVEWDVFVRISGAYDFANAFTDRGLAVVELAAPGHGLRRCEGLYGGENFFRNAPKSAGDTLGAQVRETARWIAWAHGAWGVRTGLFGVSMSSFAAQLAISHAGSWPAPARPDAAMLLAHSGDLLGVTNGTLSTALGLPVALRRAGWTDENLAPWRLALGPTPAPGIASDKIVSILGVKDGVTPFSDGEDVRRIWRIPRGNQFTYRQGHMGLPLRVNLDQAPTRQLLEILASADR